jgi:hypothetical protein
MSDLLKQMMGASGTRSSSGGGGGPAGLSKVTTETPSELNFASRELKKLLEEGPQQSIERLGSNIRDWGARQQAGMTAGQAARGVTGTGISDKAAANLESDMTRKLIQGETELESAFQDKARGVLGDIAGIGTSKAGIASGDRDAAISMYNARENARLAEQSQALAQQQAQWDLMLSALNLAGGMW